MYRLASLYLSAFSFTDCSTIWHFWCSLRLVFIIVLTVSVHSFTFVPASVSCGVPQDRFWGLFFSFYKLPLSLCCHWRSFDPPSFICWRPPTPELCYYGSPSWTHWLYAALHRRHKGLGWLVYTLLRLWSAQTLLVSTMTPTQTLNKFWFTKSGLLIIWLKHSQRDGWNCFAAIRRSKQRIYSDTIYYILYTIYSLIKVRTNVRQARHHVSVDRKPIACLWFQCHHSWESSPRVDRLRSTGPVESEDSPRERSSCPGKKLSIASPIARRWVEISSWKSHSASGVAQRRTVQD